MTPKEALLKKLYKLGYDKKTLSYLTKAGLKNMLEMHKTGRITNKTGVVL